VVLFCSNGDEMVELGGGVAGGVRVIRVVSRRCSSCFKGKP
jgi:hypothetical protein